MKVQSIYNSRILKRGLKFAAENGALFAASASLIFSAVRPAIILATPNTEKENKQYACTKSIASTLLGYFLMFAASKPVAKAIKKIDKNPEMYLKTDTMKALKSNERFIQSSKKYAFATQIFKLGLGILIAAPKSILTCALIPPIMKTLFKNKGKNYNSDNINKNSAKGKDLSFTGIYDKSAEKLATRIGNIIDSPALQKLAEKFQNTRYEQHLISIADMIATGSFIHYTNKSKKIEPERKKALIYNAAISTGISVVSGYIIDSLTKKPTEKFIEKFKLANKNSKNLDKYVEGIRVAKPVLILGTLYYIVIPLISTLLSDKFSKKNN